MKQLASLLVLALAAATLVACGGSDNSTTTSTPNPEKASTAPKGEKEVIDLEADPGGKLAYTISDVLVQEGKVTVHFKNPQGVAHDVAFEDSNGQTIGKTELIEEGETSTTIEVHPGTYHFYSTAPGDREAGMEGTMSVEVL